MSLFRVALSVFLSGVASVTVPVDANGAATEKILPSVPIFPVAPHPGIGFSQRPAVTQGLVTWTAQDVRCGGTPVVFAQAPAPMPALAWSGMTSGVKAIDYRFTIDETGRPIDVARTTTDYVPAGADLTGALVVARFAAGAARQACSLTFVPTANAVSETPVDTVMTYIMFPEQRPTPAMFARVRPTGSTCFDPQPQVRNRAFPAFDELPKRPGAPGWSMIGFDIDARGAPTHVTYQAGSGNAALDKASIAAVKDSRFAPGVRTGCQYPYWIAPATMPPPPMLEEAPFRPAGAICPQKADWAVRPALNYPSGFSRRKIEGWAIIGYDVASWGATGNVRVLAAQPSVEFGEQAMRMLSGAKRAASAAGYVGCVDRVVYRIPGPGETPAAPETSDDVPPPF